jgi:hypothetical protein
MILFWGLKKFPLRREIPALKDHLTTTATWRAGELHRLPLQPERKLPARSHESDAEQKAGREREYERGKQQERKRGSTRRDANAIQKPNPALHTRPGHRTHRRVGGAPQRHQERNDRCVGKLQRAAWRGTVQPRARRPGQQAAARGLAGGRARVLYAELPVGVLSQEG